jgi:lipoprotein-anchoring transpeptidase ErfK/SrfK
MKITPLLAAAAVASALTAALPAHAGQVVPFSDPGYRAGTIVVKTGERRLYLVLGNGRALRYVVGVGKQGKQWTGVKRIERKMVKPDWAPPPEVKREVPGVADFVRGGTPGNPLGAAALVMTGGDYAIHGTNRPGSVGGFVSFGCIRMYNSDIVSLFGKVGVGTPVVVVR